MPAIIEPPPEPGAPLPPLWKRLAWFAGLSLAGAFSTAAIAYGLRLLLR
ncbi:MAG: hypothetical protein JNK30_14795 [Phenylobacterium sp.]|nr:DUF2474 domain-containing protein [Phenylobacterium sp.]MBL8772648.1 hypothetical protein [Phenylobacterium sp.]